MTVDLTRWKEVSRRRLTSEEARQYIAGNTPTSGERSFDLAVVTTFKQNPFRGLQITYERIPEHEQRPTESVIETSVVRTRSLRFRKSRKKS